MVSYDPVIEDVTSPPSVHEDKEVPTKAEPTPNTEDRRKECSWDDLAACLIACLLVLYILFRILTTPCTTPTQDTPFCTTPLDPFVADMALVDKLADMLEDPSRGRVGIVHVLNGLRKPDRAGLIRDYCLVYKHTTRTPESVLENALLDDTGGRLSYLEAGIPATAPTRHLYMTSKRRALGNTKIE